MNKRDNIIYKIATGLFAVHTLFTIVVYFFMYDFTKDTFESLGFPAALIYPLAIVKLLGVIAIVTNKSRLLKELAYLGFVIDYILATGAHALAKDGGAIAPLIVLIVIIVSYIYHRKLTVSKE